MIGPAMVMAINRATRPGKQIPQETDMKILVGYDGSNSSKEALKVARKHALSFGASVDVVTSMEKGTEQEQRTIEDAERGLEWAKSMFEEKGVSCKTHLLIRGMAPGEDLVQFAKDNKIDEIVVGVKRRSKVGKILMGSTAQFVVLQAPCPVVSVK
jgi:nucleotide-binding universal stress UspA family protein